MDEIKTFLKGGGGGRGNQTCLFKVTATLFQPTYNIDM